MACCRCPGNLSLSLCRAHASLSKVQCTALRAESLDFHHQKRASPPVSPFLPCVDAFSCFRCWGGPYCRQPAGRVWLLSTSQGRVHLRQVLHRLRISIRRATAALLAEGTVVLPEAGRALWQRQFTVPSTSSTPSSSPTLGRLPPPTSSASSTQVHPTSGLGQHQRERT